MLVRRSWFGREWPKCLGKLCKRAPANTTVSDSVLFSSTSPVLPVSVHISCTTSVGPHLLYYQCRSTSPVLPVSVHISCTTSVSQFIRAPNDAQFARLWHAGTKIHPLQICPVHGIDPLNWLERGCLLSIILYYASAWKSGNGFPFIRHWYHSCDLGKSAMLSAQLYTLCGLCFQTLWSSGSENYNIVRGCVHYTLQSKSKYYIQNKILSLPSWLVKGWQLWTQSDTL